MFLADYNQGRDLFPSLYNGVGTFTSINQIPLVIANVIQILLTLIAVLAVIYISYAGIQYITSSGDPTKTSNAKTGLQNAVIGVLLSAGAYLLVEFVARRFTSS